MNLNLGARSADVKARLIKSQLSVDNLAATEYESAGMSFGFVTRGYRKKCYDRQAGQEAAKSAIAID